MSIIPSTFRRYLIYALGLLAFSNVVAEDKLTEQSYKVISKAQELMQEGKNKEAIVQLQRLIEAIKNKPYDSAIAWQTIAYAWYNLDKTEQAANAFIRAIETNALPDAVAHESTFNLAQILLYNENYKQAEKYWLKWSSNESNISSDAHLLAASIYQNLNQYKKMASHMSAAINLSVNPPANWYQLLASAYVELKDYTKAANTLEKVIKRKPDVKDSWLQLAAIYQLARQNQKALATTELAHKKGYLSAQQIIDLANNYLYLDMPYKAARLIEAEIDLSNIKADHETLNILATSWMLANEYQKAVAVFEKMLTIKQDPATEFQLGSLHYRLENWQKCIDVLTAYVTRDKQEHTGEAYLYMGISAYELKQTSHSLKSFHKASAYNKTREQARWWLDHLKESAAGIEG